MWGLCFLFISILIQDTFGDIIGIIGTNVTLPCKYDAENHGVLDFCWGRAEIPRFQCSNTILSALKGNVLFRQFSRYQLLGSVTDGDVSLTILNAQPSDAGAYGCRVEIPGLFNDYKVNMHLVMEEAEIWTSAPKNFEVGDQTLDTFAGKCNAFFKNLTVENIVRMGTIFFITIIIILVFIFERKFQPRAPLQHLNTSADENIYESAPAPAE